MLAKYFKPDWRSRQFLGTCVRSAAEMAEFSVVGRSVHVATWTGGIWYVPLGYRQHLADEHVCELRWRKSRE